MHARACSTQETMSPKELARPEEGPTGLFPAERTAIHPKAVSNCQGNPTHGHWLEQPAGLPCSFKVLKSLSMRDCTSGQANTKVNRCNSYEKHLANLRELPHGRSRKGAKHPKTCEKHGGMRKTAWKYENSWIRNRTYHAKSYVMAKVFIKKCALTRNFLKK